MKIKNYMWAALTVALCGVIAPIEADETAPAVSNPADASKPATPEEVPSGSIEVLQLVLCSALNERNPGQEITTAKVGDVVIGWTQIRSGISDTTVTHRWLHEGVNLGDVPLAVKGSPWRTWSRKTISEPGNWKLQVLDSQGAVLKEKEFTAAP